MLSYCSFYLKTNKRNYRFKDNSGKPKYILSIIGLSKFYLDFKLKFLVG